MATLKKSRFMVPFYPIITGSKNILENNVELFMRVLWNNLILSGINAKDDYDSIIEGDVKTSDLTKGYRFHIVTIGNANDNKLEIHVNKYGEILAIVSAFIISTGDWEMYYTTNSFIDMKEFENKFFSIIEKLK